MTHLVKPSKISAIVPTIGRPESLRRMLNSLCQQTCKVHEVVVADGSSSRETAALVADPVWERQGLVVERTPVHPPNAVRQRVAAIGQASGDYFLLLDDDVVLEPDCVEEMLKVMRRDGDVVGVFADFNNQDWPMPTTAWRYYLRFVCGLGEGEWQGRVVGPLLRFCYHPVPAEPSPIEWIGTCNSLIRRDAFEQAGGFSDFFLHRCTMNEDVDLGLKLSKLGRILFCPTARMAHHHAPGGRVAAGRVAEDDLHNRFFILHQTGGNSKLRAFGLVVLYFAVETFSNLLGCLLRLRWQGFFPRLSGRVRALGRILFRMV